ncbi:aldo/keto reductase [Sinomicrobium weinanense]|uniref:Aldo/keto reductase n=1 Tax=Sinomicrobium weinanense TaxID=2842200 RepID=A0A926JNX1_9FLAO|nr:aldo/keto reductase [Sinomicrobium weinanense]MBC9794686.1 aldo/keto reductase [Sinomicrobium weinanense]MBU3124171.1 aldo/keto reductase [Sinomicrobium weinanense]
MEYKNLGNTGLKVSSLCLGTMTFGDGADETMCHKLYTLSRDKGINFFDCANVYAKGESERILGKLIHGHRDEVVLATKAYYPTGNNINDKGLSRRHLTKELEKSLKRLNTDYIDVYYLHSFDTETPLEESLSTLNDFIRQGKVLYIGLSNFAAWQVMKAISINRLYNLAPVACIQPMYNLLKRQCESEILPMAQHEGLGVVTYSPLAGGLLTGKYLNNKEVQGRYTIGGEMTEMYQKRYMDETNDRAIKKYLKFAKENDYDPAALSIAWVKHHNTITSPIVGARNVDQLRSAISSLDIEMTPDLRNILSNFSLAPAKATDRAEEV